MAERGDIDRIRELLRQHQKGLTIEEVASNLSINRSTASKYLNSLVMSGSATIRKLGPAKLFYLRECVPLQQLLDCTFDGVIVLDADLVVQEVNANTLEFFDVDSEQVKGQPVMETPLRPVFDNDTMQVLNDLADTGETIMEGDLTRDHETWHIQRKIIPIIFQSGSPGSCIIFRLSSQGVKTAPVLSPDPSYVKTCNQVFQINTLFRRFSQNQLSRAAETLRKARDFPGEHETREFLQEEMLIIENLRFHLSLLEEYLGEEVKAPDWYLLDGLLSRAIKNRSLAHIRFFSDIRGIEIFTDRDCGRIFPTLLENSIVHGKKVTSIRVTARETGGDLLIVYTDDGIGIPEQAKPTLFEWGHGIHRAHSLFLSRQMLAITDISIKENGTYGRGVRFEILVPQGRWRATENKPA